MEDEEASFKFVYAKVISYSLAVKHSLVYSANAPRAQTYDLGKKKNSSNSLLQVWNFQSVQTTDHWPTLDAH